MRAWSAEECEIVARRAQVLAKASGALISRQAALGIVYIVKGMLLFPNETETDETENLHAHSDVSESD